MQWKRVGIDSGYYDFLMRGVRGDLFYVWHLEENKSSQDEEGEKKT